MMHDLTSDSLPRHKMTPETLTGFRVERFVRGYEKDGDRLMSEFLLEAPNLSELQDLFKEPRQNLMVDSYPISKIHSDYFQQRLKVVLDFDQFDYFLECDAV